MLLTSTRHVVRASVATCTDPQLYRSAARPVVTTGLRASAVPARLRASATIQATSAAPVAAVWEVLADPARWTQFHPCLDRVDDASARIQDPAADLPDGGSEAALVAGSRYRARLRMVPVGVPVEVDHVVDRSALSVTVRLAPGLVEELEYLLMPTTDGGSLVTIRLTLHGPFAFAAVVPRWMARTVSARLLARAAAREKAAVAAAAVA